MGDCTMLIENVKKRIDDWRNKTLFFAGRLQLIVSVLQSLHIYWASIFILPIHICNDIDKLLKGFFYGIPRVFFFGLETDSWPKEQN